MLGRIFANSLVFFIVGYLLSGVHIKNYWTALGGAILLALINTFIKPIIVFLTLPITVLTMGLSLLVINALVLMLVDALMDGLKIDSFWWALIFSILLSLLNAMFF